MSELDDKWKKYQDFQRKIEMELDLVNVLSWIDTNADTQTAYFKKIDPLCLKKLDFPIVKITHLSSSQLELIRENGIALYYQKRFYLVDKLLFQSFIDLFGMTKATAKQSFWRDLHLADMFNEYGGPVTATYRMCEGSRTIMAFHSRDLQTLESKGINVCTLAHRIMQDKDAEIKGCFYTKTKFSVELDLHDVVDSWKKTLIIRDDCVGRESLTVYIAYRKEDAVVFVDELKKSHRVKTTFENVIYEIYKLIEESTFSTSNINYKSIMSAVHSLVGKRRMADFNMVIAKKLQEIGCVIDPDPENTNKRIISPEGLLEIVASVNSSQYGNQENEFRRRLGRLCKC